MTKFNLRFLLLAVILPAALFFTNCKKDDDDDDEPAPAAVVDVRDQAIGTYDGTSKWYLLDEGGIRDESSLVQESGTIVIKKSATNSSRIDFYVDNELVLFASGIQKIDDGFIFDIPSQSYGDGDETAIIVGADDGIYDSNEKGFLMDIQGTYDSDGSKFVEDFDFTLK